MSITASLVKELRERTGVGMMECKKALTEVGADIEKAAEFLRKSGLAKADKKSGRVAAEGVIAIKVSSDNKSASMVEINSETDFLAKSEDFVKFSDDVAQVILNDSPNNVEDLNSLKIDDYSVEDTRQNLITKLGENMSVRRFVRMSGDFVSGYSHGGKIGAIVVLEGGSEDLAKDLALHIAAMNPIAIDESGIDSNILEKEKEISVAQAQESGKPPEIIEKIAVSRVKTFIKESTLLGHSFVKDPSVTIENLLKQHNAKVVKFERLEVGEGIEKKQENFADEVMAQIK